MRMTTIQTGQPVSVACSETEVLLLKCSLSAQKQKRYSFELFLDDPRLEEALLLKDMNAYSNASLSLKLPTSQK